MFVINIYNVNVVNILKKLNNETYRFIEYCKIYRPRFSYGFDNRKVAQRMLQFPVYVQGAQYVPMGVTQYLGNHGQYRPPYYQRPVTVQQNYDVREVIQPGGQAYDQQIVSGPVLASKSGQSGRAREEGQNDTPKRLKTTESTKHATLATVWEKSPKLYKSSTPSPNEQITQSIIEYFIKNHQTEDCYRKKIQLRDVLFAVTQELFPNSGLYIVGSSMSGFGTQNSDMDICLMISRKQIDQSFEAIYMLYLIKRALKDCHFFKLKEFITTANVPILRFTDRISKIECDLNVNSEVGIRNTHLLKYYCLLDWRVRPLVLFIKRWAKFHDINDARNQTLSSYSLGLMILHYLQSCTPPVLPYLQELHPDKFGVSTDISMLRLDHKLDFRSENTDTVGDLFLGFLKYYEDFDFDHDAISVRCGTKLTRDRKTRHCLFIEEPFVLSNTARSCKRVLVFDRVKRVFNVSYNVLNKKRNVDELFKAPF